MIFESMEDAYMRERAADIKDVSKRIIANLAGKGGDAFAITEENTIVVAHDLTPSDTAQLDRSKVIGFLNKYRWKNFSCSYYGKNIRNSSCSWT